MSSRRLEKLAWEALREQGFEPEPGPAALREAERLTGPAEDRNPQIRDLTSLHWISIDNDDSLDLDQLSVARDLGGGPTELLVAIADVDALVKKNSEIDQHARTNTTSIYTPVRVFPMLPEKLSHGLTSLLPDGERLAMVIQMVVDGKGHVQSSEIYRARVVNKAKLIYQEVAEHLEGSSRRYDKVIDQQLRLHERVTGDLKELREQQGALDFETIEARIKLSADDTAEIREERKNRARELIEDVMVAANGVTARFLEKHGFSSIRRVVRSPERWDRIVALARDHGEQLPQKPDSRPLERFLKRMRQEDPLRFPDLSLAVIKLMGRGEYAVERPGQELSGHFGLAVQDYAHSTAPNRRYPDLITQRLLKAALQKQPSPYSDEELEKLAAHCTEREDSAEKIERRLHKSAAALALAKRIGEQFDAVVTGASEKGTWVRILHPTVEGKVVSGSKGLDVGDEVRVKLVATNAERGFIDFVTAKR